MEEKKLQTSLEIVNAKPVEADTFEQSPLGIFQLAMSKGLDLDKVGKMIELQAKYDEIQAKKAYTVAMAGFKSEAPIIKKDKINSQYKSLYTTLGNLVNTCLPKMSEYGLSHKWDINQGDKSVEVICVVTHKDGHSEPTKMKAPPDTSGSKNPIQQIKSTITYLKSATFESAMGLASTDSNLDDDGNSSGLVYITDAQKGHILDMIASTGADSKKFLTYLKVESIDELPKGKYNTAIQALKLKAEQNGNS